MLVETRNLSKRYTTQMAVDSVDIHIEKGEIYGLVGQNGAGKTTLMKMIVGITKPTNGEMLLFESSKRSVSHQRIGALIESPGLFLNESALENMRRYALVSNIKSNDSSEIMRILDLVHLRDTGRKKVRNFSLGMKQRLGIAIALLGKPELLVLDEPTNGLDPLGIKEMRELLLKLNNEGITIFISSHYLDELSKIVMKYGIMHNGKLLEEISAEKLNDYCRFTACLKVNSSEAAKVLLYQKYPDIGCFIEDGLIYFNNTLHIPNEDIVSMLKNSGIKIYEENYSGITTEKYFEHRVRYTYE